MLWNASHDLVHVCLVSDVVVADVKICRSDFCSCFFCTNQSVLGTVIKKVVFCNICGQMRSHETINKCSFSRKCLVGGWLRAHPWAEFFFSRRTADERPQYLFLSFAGLVAPTRFCARYLMMVMFHPKTDEPKYLFSCLKLAINVCQHGVM